MARWRDWLTFSHLTPHPLPLVTIHDDMDSDSEQDVWIVAVLKVKVNPHAVSA